MRSSLITMGRKLNDEKLYLVGVNDHEPYGIIVHAYNQVDSKEYMLPISEVELAESGFTRKHDGLVRLIDTLYLSPLGGDWALQSNNLKIKEQKVVPTGENLDSLIKAKVLDGGGSIHELLITGLVELCKAKPVGIDAVRWLGNWLIENNPNKPRVNVVEEGDDE